MSIDTGSDIIIFGAMGDLSARKLFPALYHLHHCDLLPEGTRILGVARPEQGLDDFLLHLKARVQPTIGADRWSEGAWTSFSARCDYLVLDFAERRYYQALADWVSKDRTAIYYLATPPGLFEQICTHLDGSQCLFPSSRIVLEKPIGHDLASCKQVNEIVAQYFTEENTYRIDHYLGKETVQNLLVLRFANRFINTQWDQSCIDHVQITVAETVGIEGRWSYYDRYGQLRDMVQNHLMQLLCLVAMEPPNAMSAEAIREEKVKILRALRRIDDSNVAQSLVRGQYSAGWHQGNAVPGYLQEEGCELKESDTETFVAIKAHIDNWRWAGVPFYLRTGKRMAEKLTEIVITYKSLPHNIFAGSEDTQNRLVIRLQPNEGIEMQMVSKQNTLKSKLALVRQTLNLDFLGSSDLDRIPDAYERLFIDVIQGDQSLFVGREEIEESWVWCDAISEASAKKNLKIKSYHAGSWGPTSSELLIEKDGRNWNV